MVAKTDARKSFLEKVIDRAVSTNNATVVADLKISTCTTDLLEKVLVGISAIDKPIIHAVHQGETSWYHMAKTAFDALGIDIQIDPVPHTQFPTAASRPIYSVLQPSEEVLAIDSRNWSEAITAFCLEHLK